MLLIQGDRGNLWMDDGNIVLKATDNTLFRVHTAQLRLHSEFFNVTFPPTGPDPTFRGDGEVEGCPVVPLPHSSFDLENFLNGLFYGGMIRVRDLEEFLVATSIVRLAHEYSCELLLERALEPILRLWPSKRKDWEKFVGRFEFYRGIHPALVICLAEQLGMDILLPAAYYWLSRMAPSKAFPQQLFSSRGPLPNDLFMPVRFEEHTRRYHNFRAECAKEQDRFTSRFINRLKSCQKSQKMAGNMCINKLADQYNVKWYRSLYQGETDELLKKKISEDMASFQPFSIFSFMHALCANTIEFCNLCQSNVNWLIRDCEQMAWEDLPGWLGLDSWRTLAGIPDGVDDCDYECRAIQSHYLRE